VGDDQALSTCMLEFTNTVKIEGDLEVSAEIVLITKCASASALKGVKFVLKNLRFLNHLTTYWVQLTLNK
jgi:hypothetical protein